ncbi:phage baseplate upper protein [Bacillus pumilus]|uniref:phage baseplate upper protein n=1 Tax=Bacillus pumilus TaxID=1408 RepID=UPI001C22B9EC|nr:phage baseplate upper protein [Bacillus pumilus]MBU8575958.1 phage baseplate upper protein [Bacillus pumilus]
MVSKNGPLDFDVNAYTSSSVSTSINFWTQDRHTARLVFKISKDGVPLPLAAVTGKLVLVMSDGSRFIRDINIIDRVEGQAEYILSDQEIKHYGNVQAELNLYYANDQSMSVHQFSFNISKSLIDQDIAPITEYYVDEFEALREKINALYDESIKTIADLRDKFEDLENIETKQGAQSKADAALASAKKYTDEHAETPDGAQDKADATLKKMKDLVAGFQQKKITTDTGLPLISIKDTSVSILDAVIDNGLGMGSFYAIAKSKDLPNNRSFRGFFHITDATNGKGTFGWVYATDYINNIYTNYLNNNVWSGWNRLLTEKDLSSTWNQVTLVAGTVKQFAGNPLQFSIRQNDLLLRGSFEGVPANDTVIARFAQKPSGETVFGGATVGSYGSARLTLAKDGSLKFDGLNANDNSKVKRIEINESIPLW